MPPPRFTIRRSGFTLSELLMVMLILGVIATYTIPKVLISQQNAKSKSIGLEVAAALSEIRLQLMRDQKLSSSTTAADFISYMNYVNVDSSTVIDGGTCSSGAAVMSCVRLHTGAMVAYWPNTRFCDSGQTAIPFRVDPDGKVSDIKHVVFWLYIDGRIRTNSTAEPNTIWAGGGGCVHSFNPGPTDPVWFSWN